jgi:hypothetical protein
MVGETVGRKVDGVVGVGESTFEVGFMVGKKTLVVAGEINEVIVGEGSEEEHADKDSRMERSMH